MIIRRRMIIIIRVHMEKSKTHKKSNEKKETKNKQNKTKRTHNKNNEGTNHNLMEKK